MNFNKLPEDIILEILPNLELQDIKNACSSDKRLMEICRMNNKYLMLALLKRKGYTNKYVNNFLINNEKMIEILLNDFYNIDKLLTNNRTNLIKSFMKGKLHVTRFILENQRATNKMEIYKDMFDFDADIVHLLIDASRHVDSKRLQDESFNDFPILDDNLNLLVEVIRQTFNKIEIDDDTLDNLYDWSGYDGELSEDWRNCLRLEINKGVTGRFHLDSVMNMGLIVSAMTKRWEFWLEDLYDATNMIERVLRDKCSESG